MNRQIGYHMAEEAGPAVRRAAVVVNPAKGGAPNLQSTLPNLCRTEGWGEPIWLETSVDDPGFGQAREALKREVDLVIAAGGDGTVRSVAQAMAGTDTPLGIVPLGTGNLLARNLGLDVDDPAAAAAVALTGTERRIDVVRAVVDHADDGQVFLVMGGLGFDAATMANTDELLKDRVGWLAYVESGIRNLPGEPVQVTLTIDDGRPVIRRLRSVIGGNCGKLQGGLEVFPGARFDDGLLDVMTVAPRGTLGWLRVLAGLFSRERAKTPAVDYFQGKTVEISAATAQDIQLDGDHIGKGAHLSLRLQEGALLVRVPA